MIRRPLEVVFIWDLCRITEDPAVPEFESSIIPEETSFRTLFQRYHSTEKKHGETQNVLSQRNGIKQVCVRNGREQKSDKKRAKTWILQKVQVREMHAVPRCKHAVRVNAFSLIV